MKQSLQLKLGQRLTMTPQLQQAIRLLQLSTIELQQEIQTALEANMMLEAGEPTSEDETPEASANELDNRESETSGETSDTPEYESAQAADDETWSDPWRETEDTGYGNNSSGDGWDFNQTPDNSGDDLHEYLMWQLELSHFSETDHAIAVAIVDAINDDGYFSEDLDEFVADMDNSLEVDPDEVLAVLHRIQRFDPIGIGARDLQEALSIQLRSLPQDTPGHEIATALVTNHLDLLAARDFNTLMRKLKVDEDELKTAIQLIQQMNPRPGAQISTKTAEYVVPDVYVRKTPKGWKVDLNPDVTPHLRINRLYASLIRRSDSSRDNETLKQHLQEARWFIKSLHSRNETLLKVASCIVERQQAFFEHGEEAMQPMVLREIAESVEMHESTVSRVTNQKFMHTPRGILEFKYFFSSHVSTADGGECSATAIQAMIRKLIAAENPRKPLSDNKLAQELMNDGIHVARRTVAKYREAMSIPPSNERKQLV